MRRAIACVLAAACVCNAQQPEPSVDPAELRERLAQAYRTGTIAERVRLEHPRPGSDARTAEVVFAYRAGDQPALALHLGALRVVAESGRLVAWRADAPQTVFVTPLDRPLNGSSIAAALPPLVLPQIELALGRRDDLPRPIPMLGRVRWTAPMDDESPVGRMLLARDGSGTLRLEMREDTDRLRSFELTRQTGVVVRGLVDPIEPEAGLFTPPDVSTARVVSTLGELGERAQSLAPGRRFGGGVVVDARGRTTSLASMAAGANERVVFLFFAPRDRDDRDAWTAGVAEAGINGIARALDVDVVLVGVGDRDLPRLLERVTRPPRGHEDRVRACALSGEPEWLNPAWIDRGVAIAVHRHSWMVRAVVPLGDAAPPPGPLALSAAPATRAELIAEAIGRATRR